MAFYVLFYLFDTLTNVPYGALGPELTNQSDQRNSLYFFAGMFKGVGILTAAALPVLLEVYFKANPVMGLAPPEADVSSTELGISGMDCGRGMTIIGNTVSGSGGPLR